MKKIMVVLSLLMAFAAVASDTIYNSKSCITELGSLYCTKMSTNHQFIHTASRIDKSQRSESIIDSYRCGNRLIQADMTLYEVDKLCSKNNRPSEMETYLQTFKVHHHIYGVRYHSIDTYEMEKWTFKKYGRFRTYVIFRDGYVYQIIQDSSLRD